MVECALCISWGCAQVRSSFSIYLVDSWLVMVDQRTSFRCRLWHGGTQLISRKMGITHGCCETISVTPTSQDDGVVGSSLQESFKSTREVFQCQQFHPRQTRSLYRGYPEMVKTNWWFVHVCAVPDKMTRGYWRILGGCLGVTILYGFHIWLDLLGSTGPHLSTEPFGSSAGLRRSPRGVARICMLYAWFHTPNHSKNIFHFHANRNVSLLCLYICMHTLH